MTTPPSESEVSAMLRSLSLEKYSLLFANEGVEDMETALEMNEGHLAKLNIPLGHRIKIMKRLREIKSGTAPKPAVWQPQASPSPLPHPPQPAKPLTQAPAPHPPLKPPSDPMQPPKRETYELYKTALDEFRKAGTSLDSPDKPAPRLTVTKTRDKIAAPKQQSQPDAKQTDKYEVCPQCQRTFVAQDGAVWDKYRFCAGGCREKYKKISLFLCVCGKSQRKSLGVVDNGEIYCCRECVPVKTMETAVAEGGEGREGREGREGEEEWQAEEWKSPEREGGGQQRGVRLANRGKRRGGKQTYGEEELQPAPQDSTEAVRGWDAPIDASFNFDPREE